MIYLVHFQVNGQSDIMVDELKVGVVDPVVNVPLAPSEEVVNNSHLQQKFTQNP